MTPSVPRGAGSKAPDAPSPDADLAFSFDATLTIIVDADSGIDAGVAALALRMKHGDHESASKRFVAMIAGIKSYHPDLPPASVDPDAPVM